MSTCLNWRQLWMSVHDAGGAGLSTIVLGALDIGQWDLLAKQAGVPLVDYLGRVRERAPAYRCGINLHFGPEELQAQVAEWRGKGLQRVQDQGGRAELEEDIARVAAAREAAGKGLLLIDANQGWDIPTAARALRALERFDIFWIEEPLLADDIASHADLRRLVDIPIAIGENVFTQFQFKDYLVSRACDYVQADVCRVGGITPFLEIAHVAEVWGAPLSPSFMIELGGQMMCCVRNINFVEDIDGGSLTDLGVLETDLNVRGGYSNRLRCLATEWSSIARQCKRIVDEIGSRF